MGTKRKSDQTRVDAHTWHMTATVDPQSPATKNRPIQAYSLRFVCHTPRGKAPVSGTEWPHKSFSKPAVLERSSLRQRTGKAPCPS